MIYNISCWENVSSEQAYACINKIIIEKDCIFNKDRKHSSYKKRI